MLSDRRAAVLAPLVIYPVALALIAVRALLLSDPRELLVSPLSAALVTVVGYPAALATGWLICRVYPRLLTAPLGTLMLLGVFGAEVLFWGLINPFWQRDFSPLYCATLVAASGIATAWAYVGLRRASL